MATQTVDAAVFRTGASAAKIESLALAEIRDDELLVKLVATGVCHTDLTCRDGFMALPRPIILGHEGAGIVSSVGKAVTTIKPGDRVVLSFMWCGKCPNCVNGTPAYCYQFMPCNFSGRRLDGSAALSAADGPVSSHFFGQSSFSTHAVANERNVIKVRDDAPLELLGPLGCGVQTGAGAVLNVLKPAAGQSIAIFGAGGVGLSAVMAAVIAGCNPIIVVEPRPERRALALELGATHSIDPTDATVNLVVSLQGFSGGGLAHAFDTSGVPAVINQAIAALGPLGSIALVTANKLDAVMPLPILPLVGRGVTIRGVSMGDSVPKEFIPKLVDLIVEGRFPVEKLVRFYDFKHINEALQDQEHGRTVKPILRMSSAG